MGAALSACGRLCWSDGASAREIKDSRAAKGLDQWATSRPAGTPIQDEAFICMGGMAPRCPPPPPKVATGPITLDVVQGEWVGSGGAKIAVCGTEVSMNGMPLRGHRIELRDDGTVISVGSLWQLDRWSENGGIEFRASSTRENMECARLEVWSRKSSVPACDWAEKMSRMGYAGSAADPLARGIEGCMPGTSGAEMPSGFAQAKDAKDVALLASLVSQWREDSKLCEVRSRDVVPDFTNRAQTGLGVELMHYVADCMMKKGFQKRVGTQGHDIPVLVREPPSSPFYEEALQVWKTRVAEEEGFPPVRAGGPGGDQEIFTSLGNGHFFQALNLFATSWRCINKAGHYAIGQDALLAQAISDGVPSIVLKNSTPRPVRAKIAELLNSKREFMWNLQQDGTVDVSQLEENNGHCSQFEWLSKGMDAAQVDCLVRQHLGIKDSHRIKG